MGHVRIPENRIAKSSGVDRGAHWIFQKGDFQKSVWVKIGYIRIAEKVNLQIWFGGIWARRMSERIRNRTIFPKFLWDRTRFFFAFSAFAHPMLPVFLEIGRLPPKIFRSDNYLTLSSLRSLFLILMVGTVPVGFTVFRFPPKQTWKLNCSQMRTCPISIKTDLKTQFFPTSGVPHFHQNRFGNFIFSDIRCAQFPSKQIWRINSDNYLKTDLKDQKNEENWVSPRITVRMGSGWLPVARGGSSSKAHRLAARPGLKVPCSDQLSHACMWGRLNPKKQEKLGFPKDNCPYGLWLNASGTRWLRD